MTSVINKTMDRADLYRPEAQSIIGELNDLIRILNAKRLSASSWYGTLDLLDAPMTVERVNRGAAYQPLANAADDRLFPWFLYWEIVWTVLHGDFQPGQDVLDLGGSSSLFSFYLAHKGCSVVTVDLQQDLVQNADRVARTMGWPLTNRVMDIRSLPFGETFDHVTSICVFEHLPRRDRIRVVSRVREFLRPGGRLSVTFDYRNPARTMRIGSPADVEREFIEPSGLTVRANRTFLDDGQNHLLQPFYFGEPFRFWKYKLHAIWRGDFSPLQFFQTKRDNDYTFGSLFMEK